MSAKTYRTVPVRDLNSDELLDSAKSEAFPVPRGHGSRPADFPQKSTADPTDVELEVCAQTWSEHCKHRIFSASISHSVNGGAPETVDSLFQDLHQEAFRKDHGTQAGLRAQRV